MNDTDQIKAIAELDGWKLAGGDAKHGGWVNPDRSNWGQLPYYLTSRDAIIPVIQKQLLANTGHLFILYLWEVCGLQKTRGPLLLSRQDSAADHNLLVDKIWELFIVPTPAQLAAALLRATGKWVE